MHLIYAYSVSCLLILNLTVKTLWTVLRSGFSISKLGKLNWFHLVVQITLVSLILKWKDLSLIKNYFLRFLDYLNFLDYLLLSYLLKMLPRKLGLDLLYEFFFYLMLRFIFINLPPVFARDTSVVSGLNIVKALRICFITPWDGYVGFLLLLLSLCFIVQMLPWKMFI